MNSKHLLWHLFRHLEDADIDISDIITSLAMNEAMFSEKPQPGEITVADALHERYEAYKKSRMND